LLPVKRQGVEEGFQMALTEDGYLIRLVDKTIERYLGLFGALSIEGPKWCGKTWTALNHANSVVYILDPQNGYANREAARLNPASILDGNRPLLIDEWQEVPGIWDAVRFSADRTRRKGLYLLTGSVTPKKGSYSHSGAGRIARIRMHPMSLFESGASKGSVSLWGLFKGDSIDPVASGFDQDTLISHLIRGGWPESIDTVDVDAGIVPQQYLEALAQTDISHVDNTRRNPQLVIHVLAALARVTATTASNNGIVADVQARFGDITRQTVAEYLSVLKRLYVIEEIPQWFPELRDRLRLRKSPKRILADPSIAVSALRALPADLKRDPRTLGLLFENLCLRDLLVYTASIGARLSHYHDSADLEVDAIVEMGTDWAAFEVKLGAHRIDEAARTLARLAGKLTGKGAPKPSFMAVLTNGGPAYTRDDGVHVIPIDCLRD
jgi:predicted AAA+ superfamily ATPase